MTTSTPTPTGTLTVRAEGVSSDVDERLQAVLERLVARRRFHHANLAIVDGDGHRRWEAAAGPADAVDTRGTPLTPDTPFFVASITKRFLITLVLQAHERGELHLDDPLSAHLPGQVTDGLHVLHGVDHGADITLRHLASHTAGLPDYCEKPREGRSLFAELRAGEDRSWTFDDVMRMSKEQHRPHFAPQDLSSPRQRARYSDTGYQLLIRVLELATGSDLATLLDERIIHPLGLAHTWLPGRSSPSLSTPPPSRLHDRRRPLEVPRMMISSNDLMSTTGDLLRFQQALLGGELFARAGTVALLTERENRLRNAPVLRYGLGTMTFRVNALGAPGRRPVRLVGHSGSTGTWLFHCPQLDVHLVGSVDQAAAQALPFRLMPHLLRAWV